MILFLSCFARASNDYGFYPLLELYLSYRAEVRAKVACFVAGDPGTPQDKAQRKAQDAARLLELALSYRNADSGLHQVVAVGGQIGTGKTTLADTLTRHVLLPVVSSDAVRKHLHAVSAHEPGPGMLYTAEATRRTYDEMMAQAQHVLDSGRGVILDATFHTTETRARARALAQANGRSFLMVELVSDDELLRQRLRRREREGSISDAREELLPQLRSEYRAPNELPAEELLTLNAQLPPDALARRVTEALAHG